MEILLKNGRGAKNDPQGFKKNATITEYQSVVCIQVKCTGAMGKKYVDMMQENAEK